MHTVAEFTAIVPDPVRTRVPQPAPAGPSAVADAPLHVVFLSASSGGGHDGAAQALTELIARHCGGPLRSTRVDLYRATSLAVLPWMARVRYRLHGLWGLFCQATDRPWLVRTCAALLRPLALRSLRSQCPPDADLLVAVHFGAAQQLQALAAGCARRPRTAIVVTDYEAHWAWFAPADLLVVASPSAAARARAAGVPEQRLLQLPLLPCRRQPAPREPLTEGRRLRVLAAAGADGTSAGRLQAVISLLDACRAGRQLQLDVVCGRNAGLQRTLAALAGRLRGLDLRVHGHVDDLPRRLATADVALLRASPQLLTESLAAGTPVVAFDWHAHEAANADLLRRLGCGTASCEPLVVADVLARLAARADDTLARWTAAAEAAAAGVPGQALVQRLLPGLHVARPRTRDSRA